MQEVMSIITTFISNCGFPIAACVAMFIQNAKLQETLTKNTETLNEVKALIKSLHSVN